MAVIDKGLTAGQRVVVDGQYKLKPGATSSRRHTPPVRGHAAPKASAEMNISARFIKRPIGTSLLAAAILLVGVAAWPLLPVAPLPQVDFPTIQVSATLPGASPETMASNVAKPLERQFSLIAGLTEMTSTSASGRRRSRCSST